MEFACAHDLIVIDLQEHGIKFTANRIQSYIELS